MSRLRKQQQGFTAVELLITLFVAAAFLISGYQLFNLVIKDGGDVRAESRAGNVAYEYLRRYSGDATSPCAPSTPVDNEAVTVTDLTDVTVTVTVTCSQAATPSVSKVTATITYNNPQKTVRYATFVDKSKGV